MPLEVLESRQLLAPLASTPNLGGVARSVLSAHGQATQSLEAFQAQASITAKANALGPKFTGRAVSAVETVSGGYRERFANCDIYYSSATGAHEVHGDIRLKWNDLRSNLWYMGVNLGLPTSDEINDGFGGRISHFQFGDIDWTRPTGAHEVHGAILAKWNDLRAHDLNLGHPTSDQMADGLGGQISYFQGGVIDWSPRTGAHEVHGAILAKWNDLRAHGTNLGHPTSDEMNAPSDLRLGLGGRISHFERGDIAWVFPSGPAFQVGVRSAFV